MSTIWFTADLHVGLDAHGLAPVHISWIEMEVATDGR